MAKVFCTCGNPCGGFKRASTLYGKRGQPYVCGDCSKPSRELWDSYISVCDCFSKYSSPYSSMCPDCFREQTDEPYPSWKWGTKQEQYLIDEVLQARIDKDIQRFSLTPPLGSLSAPRRPALVLTLPQPGSLGDVESRPNPSQLPLKIEF